MTVASLVQRPNRVRGMPTVSDGAGLLVDPEDEEE
jgi:hypothetical protein